MQGELWAVPIASPSLSATSTSAAGDPTLETTVRAACVASLSAPLDTSIATSFVADTSLQAAVSTSLSASLCAARM